MKRTVIAAVIALAALLALPASGMGASSPPPQPITMCEIGPCTTDPFLNSLVGTSYGESNYEAYDFTQGCSKKTRTQYAQIQQIGTGIVFAKVKQVVTWCYTGTYIKSLTRTRMPLMERWPVSWEGHTWSSCTLEKCEGVAGSWQATISTQEKFKACVSSGLGLLCKTWYPRIHQYVNGGGAYSGSTIW